MKIIPKILQKYIIYCVAGFLFFVSGLTFVQAESSSINLPANKVYVGGAISSYDNVTSYFIVGYEINDVWDIQVDIPLNTNASFINGIYKFEEGRSGTYIIAGIGTPNDLTFKPGIGYSFILQNNIILKTEVNSNINTGDFEANIAAKLQLAFYF